MRPPVDEARLRAFELSRHAGEPVRIYLTGGATAVLHGWREATVDIDIRMQPDLDELFRQIPRLKKELDVNVKLASPPDFIPELDGWRERSPLAFSEGLVEVRHFDPYSQVLAKIERGFAQDLHDVDAMIAAGLVERERLVAMYDGIEQQLYRYPAIDPAAFRAKVTAIADP
jgi:hypothetical protein